jgi:membrane protease YdiL (CAAX protease family)
MLTETYPLRGLDSPVPSISAPRVRPWGFWATLGWFGVALVTVFAAQFLCGLFYVIWWVIAHPNVPIAIDSPTLEYLAIAVSMPTAAMVLAMAARRAGPSVRDYLGLVLPHRRDVLIGLGLLVALWLLLVGLTYLFPAMDQSAVWVSDYRELVGNPVGLALFWIVLVVTAPIAEEVIFRGFLMRGWSESRLGGIGALLLTSLVFAVIHLQYNALGIMAVFGVGLVLGVMRWRSGSTVLTMMMHAVWNLVAGVFIVLSA